MAWLEENKVLRVPGDDVEEIYCCECDEEIEGGHFDGENYYCFECFEQK